MTTLNGKLAIITGGYSGIGLETSKALAALGARVVVPARRPVEAREALGDTAEVDSLDLADLDSVRQFAERFLASGRRVDILVANAGVMALPETRVGPGWEAQFAINHLGHFALVNLLRPAFAPGARVIVVASGPGEICWDDPQFEKGYDKWAAYGQSKMANRLFAAELDKLGAPAGVRAFSVYPGYVLSPLQRHLSQEEMVDAGWVDETGAPIHPAFISEAEGAATTVWAATAPELDGLGGLHLENVSVAGPIDRADAERLWHYSVELTGVSGF
jgi:NAD(P)-dependent dehydrogenase (short-subunit alcohol dehydrogenase family)